MKKNSGGPIFVRCVFFCALIIILSFRVITAYRLHGLSLALLLALTTLLIGVFIGLAIKQYRSRNE